MSTPIENQNAEAYLIAAGERVASLLKSENTKARGMLGKGVDHVSAVWENPTLVAASALLLLLDFEGGRIANALEEIAESLDFIAARPNGGVAPTEHESERMLGILKADWLKQYPEHTNEEYREAMRRFEMLVGF